MRAGIIVFAIALAAAGAHFHPSAPVVTAATPSDPRSQDTTLDDQTELSLTVYNSDLALVRDVRNLKLPGAPPTCASWTSRPR